MSKKKNTAADITSPVTATPVVGRSFSFSHFNVQAIILAIIGLVFYANSFNNEFAHDDGIVIVKNEYVYSGFAGIPDIMTKDAYDSYYKRLNAENQLSGGRYRPLSMVTFAVEQQLFGSNAMPIDSIAKAYGVTGPEDKNIIHVMHIRHVVNVLLYILSVIVLLYFLRTIVFVEAPLLAFLTAFIFLIHPLHTEVVANAKSRDEIMSLLFICLTFIYAVHYQTGKKIPTLIAALICYFCALLSKEYGVTVLVLLPLIFYLFRKETLLKSLMATIPYLLVFLVYLGIRLSIVSMQSETDPQEILNNPYAFATGSQKIATEIASLLQYIKLLILPHPLSADYSYNQIPYKDFSHPLFWLSILVHLGLIAAMFLTLRKRHVLCFALAIYLLHLALVSNLIFNIGATLGERLIYHSSVGFAMAVAYGLYWIYKRIQPIATANAVLIGLLAVTTVLCGFKTIERNAEWKNDSTLWLKDVQTAPNSVLTNADAGACYLGMASQPKNAAHKKEYYEKAIGYLNKAVSMHKEFSTGYLNLGVAYYGLGNIEKACENWLLLKKYFPSHPSLASLSSIVANYYVSSGWEHYGKIKKYPEAIAEFKKGLLMEPNNAELWYNIGGAYYSNQQVDSAMYAWGMALQGNPNHEGARRAYESTKAMMPKR